MESINRVRSVYKQLKESGKFHGTIARAIKLKKERLDRREVPPVRGRILEMQQQRDKKLFADCTIVLDEKAAKIALGRAKAANPRYQEWSHGAKAGSPSVNKPYLMYETGSNRDWRRRSTFRRGIYVRSYGRVLDRRGSCIQYHFLDKVYNVIAPRGYRWTVDDAGIALVGAAGDYHPLASELIEATKCKSRNLVNKLKENAKIRKENRRKAKRDKALFAKAVREGLTVCLRDSVVAGNCLAGSMSWAQSHGFEPTRHYSPKEVLAKANGQFDRVNIVIAAALRRHRREMERGYAILSDHVV